MNAGFGSIASPLRSIKGLLELSPQKLADVDIAAMNLACAEGLPGAEEFDFGACLATLDSWANAVRRYTRDAAGDYQREPERFHHHRGYFRFLSMVTLLKHPRGLGVGYQPTAIGNMRFLDSRDDLLHGLLTRKLGTCTSLPVLFVAIGRRLGWPLHLAVAKGHLLCQWVDEGGRRINLEGACAGGGETYDDEYYHHWPRRMTTNDIASGRYLRPLKTNEEFALFLETRGHCLTDNGRFEEAADAYANAHRLAPEWSQYDAHMYSLKLARDREAGLFCPNAAVMPIRHGWQLTINSPIVLQMR